MKLNGKTQMIFECMRCGTVKKDIWDNRKIYEFCECGSTQIIAKKNLIDKVED